MRTDPRFQKWCDWLKTITDDVQTLYLSRGIFTGVIDIVKKNDRIDKRSMFFGFFINVYVDSVVMGIRRQLKAKQDGSISLAKLLTEIAENPELITRSDYYELFDKPVFLPEVINMMEGFNQFAEPTSDYIDSELVKRDLQSLKEICAAAEEYADRRIAHWDRKAPSLDLTLEDIFKALDSLGGMVQRYYVLFFAASLKIEPVPQYPIFHIFEAPWLPPSSSPESEK